MVAGRDDSASEAVRKVEDGSVAGVDYVRLEGGHTGADFGFIDEPVVVVQSSGTESFWWWWLRWCWRWWRTILLAVVVGVLILVVVKWAGPFFMNKYVIPVINWEMRTFSNVGLAAIIFGTLSLFPVILFPSTPSLWLAGMTFGYGIGFLISIAGVAVGTSLPFFIGSQFHHRVRDWLDRHPEKASIIKLIGDGNWLYQVQAVALMRISPFPYAVFNYAAVATRVKYFPYLCGTIVGMVPETFIGLYSGILIWTLADATKDHRAVSKSQMLLNVVGVTGTVAATILIGVYAKKKLDKLREEQIVVQVLVE